MTGYPNKYSNAAGIDQVVGNQPQPAPISARIVDYTQTGMGSRFEFIAKGKMVERAVTLRQAKAMTETVRGQIS